MNELNKLYLAMLKSWNAVVKDDGRIMLSANGNEYPIRIDEMDLHLPLSNVLDGNVINKVFFHPACENITSKETEVFKIMRKMTCMKLLEVFRSYPIVLFGIATAPKPKKAWRQETIDMMEPLKTARRTVRDELKGLFARMHIELEEDGLDNRFIHFTVTKGGGRNVLGERVYYKAKPTFPFYNEIVKRLARSEGQSDNQTVELNNHTVSIAALKLAVHLFQTVIPAVNNPSEFGFESTTPVAARMIAYLGCYAEIAEQLNKVQNMFRADFDKAGVYNIDLSWVEHLEELPETYRQVPVMDYNSHNTQEEHQHQAMGRNDMAGLLSVSSNQNAQSQQPMQQQVNNGQQNNQQSMMVGDYDLTPPPMQAGDRYQRTEIDQQLGRVLHHAINQQTGAPVVYHCTRRGNFLQRTELNGLQLQNQQMMNMMGMQPNMMGMQPNMMGMMNPMMAGMMGNGMMMMPPITAGGIAPSVVPDNSGNHSGPAQW
jgi:hypothetical protein